MRFLPYIKRHSKNRTLILGLLIFQCVALLTQLALFSFPRYRSAHESDLEIYYKYSTNFLNGKIPYLDFEMEYPPLALLPFSLPHVLSFGQTMSFQEYVGLFLTENVIFSFFVCLSVICISSNWKPEHRSRLLAVFIYTLSVLICAPLLPWRYDMFPVMLTILALLCIFLNKPMLSGFCLGLAVLAKLYPLLLFVVFVIYLLAGKNFRSFWRFILGTITTYIILIPVFLVTPDWLYKFISYHQHRGLQIESLSAGILLMGHTLGLTTVNVVHNYGAFHIVTTCSDFVLQWLPFVATVLLGVVLTCCISRFRQERETGGLITSESLTAYVVIVLLIFIVTNKVFSPQYVIWLLPFAPLLRLQKAVLVLVICALTIVIFPIMYSYIIEIHYLGVLLLNVRNLLVVVLLLWLLIEHLPTRIKKAIL